MNIHSTKKFLGTTEGFIVGLVALFTFLIPLLFSFSPNINFFFSKAIPLFIVTFIIFFCLIFKIFKEGKYRVFFHPLFLVSLLIPLWYLISSFMAVNLHTSLIGSGIETDTVSMVAIMFLFAFLVSYFIRTKERIYIIFTAFGWSYIILGIFHILRLFLGYNFLSFNLFLNTTSNTVGKWNEMSIISGVALLLSLLAIEFLKTTRNQKIFLYIVLVISVVIEMVTNFPLILEKSFVIPSFAVIGLFALAFFVYFLSSSYAETRSEKESSDIIETEKKRKIPLASLIVLLISIVFTFGFSHIAPAIQSYFNVSSYEERPTWPWTMHTAVATIKQKPLTGYGPNDFASSWSLNKPADVNATTVWNNDFISGVGYIPSTLIITGPIGLILWLLFLLSFMYLGVRSFRIVYKDRVSHYLTVASFLISVFLWITLFFYVPTLVTIILTFLFTGLFVGAIVNEGLIREKWFVFEDSKNKTFISILVLVVLLVGFLFWAYGEGRVVASSVYATKGAVQYANAGNEKDLLNSQDNYTKALQISPSDVYLRAITNINLARASFAINNTSGAEQDLQATFLDSYMYAYGASNDAVRSDNLNYHNYLTRGSVSESIVGLGIQTVAGSGVADAYLDAKENYEKALALNPKSPFISLLLARLEFTKKNNEAAKQDIAKALALKPNYPDGYLLEAQIFLSENNEEDALRALQVGSQNAPNADIFFSLGSLQYARKDYGNALNSFSNSLYINPNYANARYLLALTYYNLGRPKEALALLNSLKPSNPDNVELTAAISTINAGGSLGNGTATTTLKAPGAGR